MSAETGTCPEMALIEALAHGDEVPAEVVRHVESCHRCRSHLRAAQEDAAFVGRARALVKEDLGPVGAPRIPGYRVLSVIKSGAQGVVYKAVQESTSRPVAIKALGEVNADGTPVEGGSTRRRERAEREVEIVARLRHANIVTIHESRTLWDGRIALVMEFIDGVPLDRWTPPGASVAERRREYARTMVEIAGAVHHAHLNGVIHRDLKPDNILVTPEGRPVVLDFGVAKFTGPGATLTGEFAGTPAYASPEQVAGKPDDVDALTDVYSLGVLLYRLICGRMPYEVSGSIFEMARIVSEVEPLPPREVDPDIGGDLSAVIMMALRKDKTRRYQSAAALARDLERCLAGQPVEARSDSGWYVLRKAVGMNRRRLGAAAVVGVLLACAGIAVSVSLARASASARLAAERQQQARAEFVRGRAVSEFLREAFPSADPRQPEFNGLIGQGLNRLFYRIETGGYADDPDVDQEIRRLWGNVYTGFGGKAASLIEYAEISLRHGLVRLKQKHQGDHEEVAATMHQLGGVLLVRKRVLEAERVARDTVAMRERLHGAKSAFVGESRALLAKVLLAKGAASAPEAEREAEAALAVLGTQEAHRAGGAVAAMLALKARLRLDAKQYAEAEGLVREALRLRLGSLATDDAEFLASLADAAELADAVPDSDLARVMNGAYPTEEFGNAGAASVRARVRQDAESLRAPARGMFKMVTTKEEGGAYSHRTEAVGRLIHLHEQLMPESDASLLELLLDHVRAAEMEARPKERAESALRSAQILTKRFGATDFSVLMCLQEAALAQSVAGNFDEAVNLSRQAIAIWDSIDPKVRDPLLSANARRYQAWFLSLAGRFEETAKEADLAARMLAEVVGTAHHATASCRSIQAYAMLRLGNLSEADALSKASLRTATESKATPVDQMSSVRFVRGRVLTALARGMQGAEARATRSEALVLLTQAWEGYLRRVHTEGWYAWTNEAVQDAAELCRDLGDAAAEERWKRESGQRMAR